MQESAAEQVIENVRQEFVRAKDGMVWALAMTPDERINWSPTPTARTPLQQVAHAAAAIGHIHGWMDGRPFPVPTTAEADAGFRDWERSFTTREEVLGILTGNSDAFLAWLNALTPEQLASTVETPFGLGRVPISLAITFPAAHTRSHIAQIEYIQTIYGDQDWHLPKTP